MYSKLDKCFLFFILYFVLKNYSYGHTFTLKFVSFSYTLMIHLMLHYSWGVSSLNCNDRSPHHEEQYFRFAALETGRTHCFSDLCGEVFFFPLKFFSVCFQNRKFGVWNSLILILQVNAFFIPLEYIYNLWNVLDMGE